MRDPDITLYHWPDACSQVSLCALEMTGLTYRLELVDLSTGEQRSRAYLAISPLGKVPHAVVDGVGLSESLAIISYLAALRPSAGILPRHHDPLAAAKATSALAFVACTLHPIVRGLANPQRVTTTDREGVREMSRRLAANGLTEVEARLTERDWILGVPSIVDVYLRWAISVAEAGGFDMEPFPRLVAMTERLSELPAFARMLAINEALRAGTR